MGDDARLRAAHGISPRLLKLDIEGSELRPWKAHQAFG